MRKRGESDREYYNRMFTCIISIELGNDVELIMMKPKKATEANEILVLRQNNCFISFGPANKNRLKTVIQTMNRFLIHCK